MKPSRNPQRILLLAAIIFANIALDQTTKLIAKGMLQQGDIIRVLGDFFILTPAENDGAFLSMFSGAGNMSKIILMIVLPIIAMIGALAYVIVKKDLPSWFLVGIGCIVGGGISNLYDRLLHEMFVFDFMNMGIGWLRTGIFNFADASIMLGIGILLLGDYLRSRRARDNRAPES